MTKIIDIKLRFSDDSDFYDMYEEALVLSRQMGVFVNYSFKGCDIQVGGSTTFSNVNTKYEDFLRKTNEED